jgi:hypothetical protein
VSSICQEVVVKIAFLTASVAAFGSMIWSVGAQTTQDEAPDKHGRLLELPHVVSSPISDELQIDQESDA